MEPGCLSTTYNAKGKRAEIESRLRQVPLLVDEFGYVRIAHIEETQGQVTNDTFTVYERQGGWSRDVAIPGMQKVVRELRLEELA